MDDSNKIRWPRIVDGDLQIHISHAHQNVPLEEIKGTFCLAGSSENWSDNIEAYKMFEKVVKGNFKYGKYCQHVLERKYSKLIINTTVD